MGECGQLNLSWISGSKTGRDKPGAQAFGQWPWAQALKSGTRALQPSTEGHTRRWSHKHTINTRGTTKPKNTTPQIDVPRNRRKKKKKHFNNTARSWKGDDQQDLYLKRNAMKAIDNRGLRRDRSCASGVQKMHQMAWRKAGARGDHWIGTTGITEVTKMWIKHCKERRRQ